MDSGNESEPSSIKLRKYAKKARIGILIQLDGQNVDVPGWEEEEDRINEVIGEIARLEKCFGPDARASLLRPVFELNYSNFEFQSA